MSFEPREYLRHILAEAEYLLEHSCGLDQASFYWFPSSGLGTQSVKLPLHTPITRPASPRPSLPARHNFRALEYRQCSGWSI